MATIVAASELVFYGLTYWDFRPLVEGERRDRLETAAARGEDAMRRAGTLASPPKGPAASHNFARRDRRAPLAGDDYVINAIDVRRYRPSTIASSPAPP